MSDDHHSRVKMLLNSETNKNVITRSCYPTSKSFTLNNHKNNTRRRHQDSSGSQRIIISSDSICSHQEDNNSMLAEQSQHSIASSLASSSNCCCRCCSSSSSRAASNLSSLFVGKKKQTRPQQQAIVCRRRDRTRIGGGNSLPIARQERAATIMNCNGGGGKNYSFVFLLSLTLFVVGQLFLSQANGIKLQPEGKEKFYWSGEQFVITCQNNNNIKNVKIRWIGPNGSYITEDRSQRIHAESSGPHGHRLVVMNATVGQDDGAYKCTIGSTDDRQPRETTGFALRLFQTTNFRETQKHLVLPMGPNGGSLNCHVEFDQQVASGSVSWHRDGKPIEMFNDSTYQVIDYDSSRQLSQLIIRPVQREHAARYTCRAVAVTSELSKISDFDIELEVHFAPQFEQTKQIVWVESGHSVALRNSASGGRAGNVFTGGNQQRQGGGNHRLQKFPHFQQHSPNQEHHQQQQQHNESAMTTAGSSPPMVRVELRCACQANPAASILWTSTQRSNFLLAKGEPAHVLEEPRVEVNGYNTSSTLVIGYLLDPTWPYRRDNYLCSASNKFGEATKTFTIEQGDPPPAFHVDKTKISYNPQTALIRFTIQASPPSSSDGSRQSAASPLSDIVPPVDSFRIRAESSSFAAATSATSSSSSSSASSSHLGGQSSNQAAVESRVSYSRRQLEPSVQWSIADQQQQQEQESANKPYNFTVNLGRLPAGQQRLFLEAHNAVGWSPNSTYLGEYYLVSGASANGFIAHLNSLALLIVSLATSLYFLSNAEIV